MLLTLFVFFIILSILIFVHEAGHFLVAKKLKIRVEEFGFGLPPRIFSRKRGETVYSINLLPIGGFVRLTGEDAVTKNKDPRSFVNKKPLERSLVLLSGVIMNFILAVIVLSIIFTKGVAVSTERVHIEDVAQGSPAEVTGLRPGDILISVDGNKIIENKDIISYTAKKLGKEIVLIIYRGSEKREFEIKIIPRAEYPSGEGPLGVAISNLEMKKYPWYQAPFLGVTESINISGRMVSGLGLMITNLITRSEVPKDIAGPIGIFQVTGKAVGVGTIAVLQLLGFLSLNLAVVNSLPFPALDGGRFIFVLIEMIFGRKVVPRFERYAHTFGMVVLLTLIVLVSISDIGRIVEGTNILEKLKNVIR